MSTIAQIYHRGHHYDRLYELAMQPFWREVAEAYAGPSLGPILEMGCGTGRIAIPLAQTGYAVTGLDAAPSMLDEARRKAAAAGVTVDWRAGDMRAFDLGTRFGLAILAHNALCHLLTLEDFERWTASVRRHLRPDGWLVVEVFVPDLRLLLRDPEARFPYGRYVDPDSGEEIVVTHTAWYDPVTQIRYNRTYYRFPGRADEEVGELPLRMYFPQELDALFAYNGFAIEHKYGGLDRRPFDGSATTQVYVLRRTANAV
jgi:SAM-dependent methyltransferase